MIQRRGRTAGPQVAPSPLIGTRRESRTLSVAPARGLQETQPPFLPEAGAQVTCTGSQHSPDSGVGLSKHEGHLAGRRGLSTCPLVLSRWCLQGHLIILTSICQVSLIFPLNSLLKSHSVKSKVPGDLKGQKDGRTARSQVEVPRGCGSPSCALQRLVPRAVLVTTFSKASVGRGRG